jgi:hypothetical protein
MSRATVCTAPGTSIGVNVAIEPWSFATAADTSVLAERCDEIVTPGGVATVATEASTKKSPIIAKVLVFFFIITSVGF